jgi:zinc-binding in reverse transcriptase
MPLAEEYASLYQKATNKDESVADCFALDRWHVHTHNTLTDQAWQQLLQLQARLQDFTPNQDEDIVVWTRHLTGNFSTRSAYWFIMWGRAVMIGIHNLWSISAPLRVQIFIWLKVQNKILTLDNLNKRGWQMSNICYMCRNHDETVKHLFHDCTLVIQLRNYIQDILPSTVPACQLFTAIESTQLIKSKHHDKRWR